MVSRPHDPTVVNNLRGCRVLRVYQMTGMFTWGSKNLPFFMGSTVLPTNYWVMTVIT